MDKSTLYSKDFEAKRTGEDISMSSKSFDTKSLSRDE